uniref:ORMDL family protein n=1 Tax=Rhizophora mucronata TaxID=61149 RepID=A0A2P2MEJ1_RHIMU
MASVTCPSVLTLQYNGDIPYPDIENGRAIIISFSFSFLEIRLLFLDNGGYAYSPVHYKLGSGLTI